MPTCSMLPCPPRPFASTADGGPARGHASCATGVGGYPPWARRRRPRAWRGAGGPASSALTSAAMPWWGSSPPPPTAATALELTAAGGGGTMDGRGGGRAGGLPSAPSPSTCSRHTTRPLASPLALDRHELQPLGRATHHAAAGPCAGARQRRDREQTEKRHRLMSCSKGDGK